MRVKLTKLADATILDRVFVHDGSDNKPDSYFLAKQKVTQSPFITPR